MAEHLKQKVEPVPQGLNLLGKPLVQWRRERAREHAMAMGLDNAMSFICVNEVAEQYERDAPYEAQARSMKYLDLTGHYRLMAALLADPEKRWMQAAHEQEGWPLEASG